MADQQSTVEANIRLLMKRRGIGGIQALREAMKEAGVKIGAGTIQRALQGGGSNRMESLGKFAQFFDVATDQLLQPGLGLEEVPDQGPTGEVFEALSADERRLLDNFREIVDEDEQRELAEEIANRAAKQRAIKEKIVAETLHKYGIKVPAPKHAADAKKTALARAELDITDKLRQESLFDDNAPAGKKH